MNGSNRTNLSDGGLCHAKGKVATLYNLEEKSQWVVLLLVHQEEAGLFHLIWDTFLDSPRGPLSHGSGFSTPLRV